VPGLGPAQALESVPELGLGPAQALGSVPELGLGPALVLRKQLAN